MKLDENQQKAVEHFEGPALVVAGPGSGKTTVIKERILNLIRNHNVDPKHILAIAFTNAAAAEMDERLSIKGSRPKICTLHVFGKDLIEANFKQADFAHKPNNIWEDKKIGEIINEEKSRLIGKNEKRCVAIYRIEDKTTHQCYIGQTINPNRRKKEHFDRSSNRRLREAIQQKGEKAFDFTYEWVPGGEADREETDRIASYKRHAAVNLNKRYEQIDQENSNIPITTYKIEDPTTVTCYFGQTTDLESIDKPAGFEIIGEEETWDQASRRIEIEIEKHKNWAVFNEEDPLHAQDSTRRRIEVFCEHFNVSYDEVLEHTQKFEHEMRKFDRMKDDIVKEKRKVYTGKFKPEEISDPVLRAFAKRYEDYKTKAKAIDFLDMLIRSANMLETHPNLHQYYRDKHRYVFVDEFQDISPVDFRLIDLFSENLFAVGDDDQAIYGFRGGDSSIMQQKFGKRRNVAHYEITRNYRSTSTIVRHAKVLIEHNPVRIPKDLRAKNSAHSQVKVLKTSKRRVKAALLRELSNLLTTDFQKVGILARNWRDEINEIQEILKSAKLDKQGFEIAWEALDDPRKDLYDPDGKNRRIMVIRRGEQKIEVLNIHTAKGREWDKVIFLVNTMYESLPRDGNDPIDERRLFYVAATRARQELVVLDGGNCQFISEFQNVSSIEIAKLQISQTKEELEKTLNEILAALETKLRTELEEATKAVLAALKLRLKKEVEKIKLALPQQLKSTNHAFLEGLIPILDDFESFTKNLLVTAESNGALSDLAVFAERIQLAHTQLIRLSENHGLKQIQTLGQIFNPTYHEKILPTIHSDDIPADKVIREERRGYLLHDQVIRKAQVIVSKGENIRIPEQLNRIVEIYLERLIDFRFGPKYDLDKPTIKRRMTKYLSELDDESLEKIHSAATIDTTGYIKEQPLGNYCVGQATTYMCTDIVFRNFWKHMWEVVKQSKKTPKSK